MNKQSKAERTRQFIIETTADIFNKKGYAGTSMSDLTEATGLTKGSIYGNFENKEEVALAVFEYNYGKLVTEINHKIGLADTYYDKLMVYTKFYHSFTRTYFTLGGCPILNTAVEADDTNTLLKEKAAKAVTNWQLKLEKLIRSGIEAGEFKQDANETQLAVSMIALIEGGIMIAKVTDNPKHLDTVLSTIKTIVDLIKR